MKRLIASRRLRRTCVSCGRHFNKGDVYYKIREIFKSEYGNDIAVFETIMCPKCNYKAENSGKRFELFKGGCTHPEKFVHTKWRYMDGEAIMEPDYDYCELCGNKIY